MSRPNKKKFAIFSEPYMEVNWKQMIADFLLKNRGRRFSSSEIRDGIVKTNSKKLKGFPKEIVISRISATLISMERTGSIRAYPFKEEE